MSDLKFIELNSDKTPKVNGKIDKMTYNTCENLENAGVLLNENVVLVDFDNDNINEQKIIDYFDTNFPTLKVKTTKGYHFYYSKPENLKIKKSIIDVITVGGFQVDLKNSNKQYSVVKLNGNTRETNRPFSFDNLPELPVLFYPLTKREKNLSGMKEHDGRNDTLFRHLCSIQTTYSSIELSDVANFINNFIFAEGLDENELQRTIESAIRYYDPNEYHKDKSNMIEFAQWIIPQLDVKLYNTKLFFKDDNKYICNDKKLLRKITQYAQLKKSQDYELLYQMNKFADEVKTNLKELPILLKNGYIINGEFSSIENDIIPFSPFYLDVGYDPNVYDENVDKFLNDITCNRKELRLTLEEVLGHILLTNKFPAHVFFLSGSGNNGKSTFLEMINNFVGDLGQTLSLNSFNDDTSIATLIGKLCNCSDETDDVVIDKCKGYKSLASGNTITVRPIYSQPIKVQNTATLILNANKMPNFKDRTQGFFRRLVIIPFDFVIKNKIDNIDSLLSTDTAKSYILNLALKGVERIKSNNYKITENEFLIEKKNEYISDTDSVASFIMSEPTIDNEMTEFVYCRYADFCNETSLHDAISKTLFTRRLRDFGYVSKVQYRNGKSIRVYKKIK